MKIEIKHRWNLMETKHTPPTKLHHPVGYVPQDDNASILAERDRLKAVNAELLTALEQCEDLLADLEKGGAENPELQAARAAIAKAKGDA